MKYKKILAAAVLALSLTGCRDGAASKVETARETALGYMDKAQYEAASTAFEDAYRLCDDKMPQTKTDLSLYEAACLLKLQNYERVKEVCTRILELGENADAYYMRGVSFLQSDDQDTAKADFDCAVALDAANYAMYLNIYRQYEQKNLSALGDAYLQQALHIEGEEMEDYYQKGCIYFYLQDYGQAQQMLAAPVEAKHRQAMELMGEVYLAQNDSVHARNTYQRCMEEFGETPQAYNGIVLCELADGNYDAAIAAADQGLALEGEDGRRDLLYNQIVAYERKEDFAAAKEKAAQFVEQYPDDAAGQKEYDFLVTR